MLYGLAPTHTRESKATVEKNVTILTWLDMIISSFFLLFFHFYFIYIYLVVNEITCQVLQWLQIKRGGRNRNSIPQVTKLEQKRYFRTLHFQIVVGLKIKLKTWLLKAVLKVEICSINCYWLPIRLPFMIGSELMINVFSQCDNFKGDYHLLRCQEEVMVTLVGVLKMQCATKMLQHIKRKGSVLLKVTQIESCATVKRDQRSLQRLRRRDVHARQSGETKSQRGTILNVDNSRLLL